MTKEKATTIIENCKEQWQMLLREDLCDETEGKELIEAFDMALSALSENKGEWILQYRDAGVEFYVCNKCNKGRAVLDGSFYKSLSEFKCCPNCGADMRGE